MGFPRRSSSHPFLPRVALIVVVSALGIAAASVKAFKSDESKARRSQQKKRKDLQALAERISRYGQSIHHSSPVET
jgi:hypothetical protein